MSDFSLDAAEKWNLESGDWNLEKSVSSVDSDFNPLYPY